MPQPFAPRHTALATAALLIAHGASLAQNAAPAPAAAASAPVRPPAANRPARPATPPPATEPQRVEITGAQSSDPTVDERRRAVAGRIVIGREELDRMGDASLGDVLKRLPGVTMGGPPGRGSGPRMRGMGGGYTQILIDGQRVPPGFSLDTIPPEQIERIEVMRAPVAEYGTRAIAGTINVVMRSDFKRRNQELRVGAGVDGSRPQAGGSLQYTGQTEAFNYNLTANLMHGGQDSESRSHSQSREADGDLTEDQDSASRSRGQRSGLFTTVRLQFRLAPGSTLELQPFFNASRGDSRSSTRLQQNVGELPAYTLAEGEGESQQQMGRLAGNWASMLGNGGRLNLRFGGRLASSESHSQRIETGGTAALLSAGQRERQEDSKARETGLDLNGKFQQLLGESHSVSVGWELEHSRRRDSRVSLINGIPDPATVEFGENLEARVSRAALYAQDEWEWTKQLSFYVGARWEGIRTQSDTAAQPVSNRSSVFTPLAHLVYRLPDVRDQLRMSLTRSYRSPNTNQMIGRLSTSSKYPDLDQSNDPLSPDRIGNPALKPELAMGLELAFEHYLDGGGVLSANAYWRRIDDLIRNVTTLEQPFWSSAPRYVSRPQNIGRADAAGLELEAKLRAQDLWATDLPLQLRANTSLMWSSVDGVPGPDNRLEGQPKATLNLGADWPIRGTPLTVGGSWNYTPSFEVQQFEGQSARQGRKSQVDAYALWRFGAQAAARLTVSNAGASPFDSGTAVLLDSGASQRSDSWTKTYTTVNLRAELRF